MLHVRDKSDLAGVLLDTFQTAAAARTVTPETVIAGCESLVDGATICANPVRGGTVRYVIAVILLTTVTAVAQSSTPEFEVASIKRNTAPITAGPSGTMQNTPKGEVRMVNV